MAEGDRRENLQYLTPEQSEQVTEDLVLRVVVELSNLAAPATSSVIADLVCVQDGASHPVIRAAITEAVRRALAPICAGSTGYFIARTEGDVVRYEQDLTARAQAIANRAHNVRRAWEVQQGRSTSTARNESEYHWVPDPEEEPR